MFFIIPLLLLYPDHGLSEPLDLLLNLLAVKSLAPVCREHHLHCLPINLVFRCLSLLKVSSSSFSVEDWRMVLLKNGGVVDMREEADLGRRVLEIKVILEPIMLE